MTLETGPHQIQLTCKGLFTMPNMLSEVPAGSLTEAQNVVVDYDGLVSSRRGLRQYTNVSATPNTNVFQEFFYAGTKLIWYGLDNVPDANPLRFKFAYDSDNVGTWIQTTSGFSPPAYTYTDTYRTAQSNGNFYITSSTGELKTDAPANPLYTAGAPPGLDGIASLTGSSGFMATNTEVAYRMTWARTDANNNTYEGTPSTRVIVANNSGGSRNVQLIFTIPVDVQPTPTTTSYSDQYRIYRSLQSASGTTEPSDELQLVLQGTITSTDYANGFFTVTDTVPESLLGAALYTNSGQQGIAQANAIPPLANDICFFQGYVIYGSATTQNVFSLSLLSCEPPNGLQLGDTITIATDPGHSITLTASVGEDASHGEFQLFTGGDPASDILLTKESLIRIINRDHDTGGRQKLVYAFDATNVNNGNSLPGDFFIQEQGISRVPFGVATSRPSAFFPVLTATPSDNLSTTSGFIGSGFCSKFQQPESVPVVNTISVGNQYFEWYRCLPLRNSVIVLKADGCFQLTGTAYPFTVTTLDLGTILTAPESSVVMSNQVFAFTNQGVVAITETGPGIISRPIENTLQELSTYLHPQFPIATFGTAYETDRKYILSTVSSLDGFQKATVNFVYDTITETWTQYKYPVTIWDLHESPYEHRLYAASADSAYPSLFQERKTFTVSDFADIENPTTIIGVSGKTVHVSSSAKAQVGWSLAQLTTEGNNEPSVIFHISVITSIPDSTHVVVEDVIAWDTSGTIFTAFEQPIPVAIMYNPIIGNGDTPNTRGNPAVIKFFQEIQLFFQLIDFEAVTLGLSSDFTTTVSSINLVPIIASAGWGQFPWGDVPWGGDATPVQSIRTYIPLAVRRAHWLNVSVSLAQAMTSFTLAGLVLTYRPTTTRSK